MRIAICDDEKVHAGYLRDVILKWAAENSVPADIDEFNGAESFLFDWTPGKYDAVLLDIKMGYREAGLTLARDLRKSDDRVSIIFVTAFDDFIGMGYDVSALHYLVKPVSEEKLRDVLRRALENKKTGPRMVVLPQSGGNIRVKEEDIIYAEMFSHTAEVHTVNQMYRINIKMTDLEQKLGDNFFRCHRSYILNMAHTQEITRTGIRLANNVLLPLSRKLYSAANEKFIAYYIKNKE